MKKTILIGCLLIITGMTFAQPSWVKKATKSIFTLKTFSADGSLMASSNGFFIGSNGEAVSNFSPFKGASRALIIDAQGKEMQVVSILGANDMYDVVKFRVNGSTQPLSVSMSTAPINSLVWMLPYHETKLAKSGIVRKTEKFQNYYNYYTVALKMPENTVSCPMLNENGEVVGIMQQPATENDTLSYAVSINFADSLRTTAFSLNDATLQQTSIKKELPDNLNEATLALLMWTSQMDSTAYVTLVDDFIQKFPSAPDGYTYRAQLASGRGDFTTADKDMQQAIKLADKKEDAHFSYAKLIYNKEIFQSDKPYPNWSLDKALEEIRTAIAIQSQPAYRQTEANILYAQNKFDEAYQIYNELTNTNLRGAEVFFAAAKCKEMLKDTTAMLALMDSTINTFSRPYLKEAAPYLWTRAMARRDAGKFRDAINDMTEYEELMRADINDNFYYIRHQVDIQGRLYQQALNDINQAITMNPEETLYYAEKSSLQIRVGLYDDAIQTAQECIKLDPKGSDGYLFLGLAQCLKGQKNEGLKNLQKAKDMGDTQADGLIQKYAY